MCYVLCVITNGDCKLDYVRTTRYKLGLAVPPALIGNVMQEEHANLHC